jgi:formate dehydrogenase beta subunit
MGITRRTALKRMFAAGGASLAAVVTPPPARADVKPPADALGLLYDATKCIGCKACMVACNKANDLEPDTRLGEGRWQMPIDLNAHTKNIIKLYQDEETEETSFVKRQCMHCVDPACTNACMLGALQKREHGIVTYRQELCMGCRYCMMACPFNVPKFEWERLASTIVKCELCNHRIADGKQPACSEVCPTGAVIFGQRADLLEDAHKRIEDSPDRYIHKVYGEKDAGGTQVLYLSHVDFTKLGLPDIGDRSVPEKVRAVQETVYRGFLAPVVLYGVLATLAIRNNKHRHLPGSESHGGSTPDSTKKEPRS